MTLPDDWWPDWMQDLPKEDPLAASRVVVAEIERTNTHYQRYRQLFTALAPSDLVNALLEHPGGIGHEVSTSGPHPADFQGQWNYSPQFWIDANGAAPEDLEPLVVSWRSNNHTVLWPDQGFLMTYGLVPRFVAGESRHVVHWDDPEAPRADIVIATTHSTYDFPRESGATVTVERDFLEDYATIRERSLIQVYYVQRSGPLTDDIRTVLGGEDIRQFHLRGRLLDIRLLKMKDEHPVLVQAWGLRSLLEPGSAPISAGRWDRGRLVWPGFNEPMIGETASRLLPSAVAYVSDQVLGFYEGRPGFAIHPESGSVSYGGQWSVSSTHRVGRDLIAVDLKRLYEGNHADTIKHWFTYAVEPPANVDRRRPEPNVGTQSREIVYGLVDLGEALERLTNHVSGSTVIAKDFVRLDRGQLEYAGWWTGLLVEPITRHIPLQLTKDEFLSRCNDLTKLVIEGLAERHLRRLVQDLGVPVDDVAKFRSLKLLDLVVRLAELASRSGLELAMQGAVLYTRFDTELATKPIARLFALNDLRQLADHRSISSERQKLEATLKAFHLDPNAQDAGWGRTLDQVYEGIADDLKAAARLIATGVKRNT